MFLSKEIKLNLYTEKKFVIKHIKYMKCSGFKQSQINIYEKIQKRKWRLKKLTRAGLKLNAQIRRDVISSKGTWKRKITRDVPE